MYSRSRSTPIPDAHRAARSMWLSWFCGQRQGPIAWLTRRLAWAGSSPSRIAASGWTPAHTQRPPPLQALLSPQAAALHAKLLFKSTVLIIKCMLSCLNNSQGYIWIHSRDCWIDSTLEPVRNFLKDVIPVSFPTHRSAVFLLLAAV